MDIRHLQAISEIVNHNSFTKAAEALHVTQPTISKMIKSLEQEMNIEIFARAGKQVKLTDAGETIFKHAGPILQLFDLLVTEINDLIHLNKGSIRLGIPPMVGSSFFPFIIKRFQERYPGIALQMEEDGALKIEERLAEGALDVGVMLLPIDREEFDWFPIVEDRLNVLLHPAHRLASRKQIELAELKGEQFILFNSDFALHDRILQECRNMGFKPHVAYKSTQWDFIGEMVGAGLGVAMLPDTICRSLNPDKVRAVPLMRPVIPWHLAMAWRREGYLSVAAREWIQFTRQAFGQTGGG